MYGGSNVGSKPHNDAQNSKIFFKKEIGGFVAQSPWSLPWTPLLSPHQYLHYYRWVNLLELFAIIHGFFLRILLLFLLQRLLWSLPAAVKASMLHQHQHGWKASQRHIPKIPKNRLFRGANAAQECDNVAFVLIHGIFEGGNAAAAGRRVSGEQEHERKASSIASHWSVAAASASAEISSLHTSTRPQ
jgi:hypothetical protein